LKELSELPSLEEFEELAKNALGGEALAAEPGTGVAIVAPSEQASTAAAGHGETSE
jgi:hypothetical protein